MTRRRLLVDAVERKRIGPSRPPRSPSEEVELHGPAGPALSFAQTLGSATASWLSLRGAGAVRVYAIAREAALGIAKKEASKLVLGELSRS